MDNWVALPQNQKNIENSKDNCYSYIKNSILDNWVAPPQTPSKQGRCAATASNIEASIFNIQTDLVYH